MCCLINIVIKIATIHYNPRWEVRCCRVLGKCTRECCLSDAINVDGGGINYSPGDGVFFTGIFSDFLF